MDGTNRYRLVPWGQVNEDHSSTFFLAPVPGTCPPTWRRRWKSAIVSVRRGTIENLVNNVVCKLLQQRKIKPKAVENSTSMCINNCSTRKLACGLIG